MADSKTDASDPKRPARKPGTQEGDPQPEEAEGPPPAAQPEDPGRRGGLRKRLLLTTAHPSHVIPATAGTRRLQGAG